MLDKVTYLEQVTGLSIDRTDKLLDKCRSIVFFNFIVQQVCPLGLNLKLLIFNTTVNSRIVAINYLLTLGTVRFYNCLFHLLNRKVYGNDTRYTEECRLQYCIGTITQAYLLSYFSSVYSINGDIVLGKVTLYLVGYEFLQLLAFEYGVKQECAVLLQTPCHIVHMQVGLNVASHKVRCGYQIGGTDGSITETQM
ncbi:MAG: hypothetical protein BWY95_01563 [Bacteroidetes bacterium ADurb.BinA104]|nr:MAG: hypothetical protein BWY95_01563 [Bacteroidetes bacterium ADurb.BinA104]